MTKKTIEKRIKRFCCWNDAQISDIIIELQKAQSSWATKIDIECEWGEYVGVDIYAVSEVLESDEQYEKRLEREKNNNEYTEERERSQLADLKAKYES